MVDSYVIFPLHEKIGDRTHLGAATAAWHTQKQDTPEKWKQILNCYDHLLQLEYSPIAALNRVYSLSKVHGNANVIRAAEELNLRDNQFYFSLLGKLYAEVDIDIALTHYQTAYDLAQSTADKILIKRIIADLRDQKH